MLDQLMPLKFKDYVVSENKLDLSNQAILDEHISSLSEFLRQHPHITQVDLHNNRITAKGAALLAKVTSIRELNISNNQLGPFGAKHIAKMYNLESLDISNNDIQNDGTNAVAKLQAHKLSHLSIVSTEPKTPKINLNHPVSSLLKLSFFIGRAGEPTESQTPAVLRKMR